MESQAKEIYDGKLGQQYDRHATGTVKKLKLRAIERAGIRPGDSVLIFCCGTGAELEAVLAKTGPSGRVLGVDFSKTMLAAAREKVRANGWTNVTLLEQDVLAFDWRAHLDRPADVGLCTLGLSTIPDGLGALGSLLSAVRSGGRVVVTDMQLASGLYGVLNPLTALLARGCGGGWRGHARSRQVIEVMERELLEVEREEFYLRTYFIASGTRPAPAAAQA